MRLVSVNCGLPQDVQWRGATVTTGIYKRPVVGPVALRRLNLEGDGQADLAVHGGEDKAVYCYPLAHYDYWKTELPDLSLSAGMFGENFTTEGLLESTVFPGDRFSIGSAEVVVTQPRLPCYKLGIRFQSNEMVKRFLASGRMGFYLAVTREGMVAANDEIILTGRETTSVSVVEIARLYIAKNYSAEDLGSVRRALAISALPESWKEYFRERLERLKAKDAESESGKARRN